jgi:hypothetical protein
VVTRQIRSKSNATVSINDNGAAIHLVLSIDISLGPEGFSVANLSNGGLGASIAGGDARGVYYGLGKLMRVSTFGPTFVVGTWRGKSAPIEPNGFRGMYLATHFENFFQAAPLEKVAEYIEDLSFLWGANTVVLEMPWEEYSGFDDPGMLREINITTALFAMAKTAGLQIGLVSCSNQGFTTRAKNLSACYPLPGNHFGEFNADDPQVSTVAPGGMEYLVNNYKQLLDTYHASGTHLDFFVNWPYDEGGSACAGEWPWGSTGFANLSVVLSSLVSKRTIQYFEIIINTRILQMSMFLVYIC